MINVIENYRLALAKRKAARSADRKAHKHRKLECAYIDNMAREERARIEERNEMAGLVFLAADRHYPAE